MAMNTSEQEAATLCSSCGEDHDGPVCPADAFTLEDEQFGFWNAGDQ